MGLLSGISWLKIEAISGDGNELHERKLISRIAERCWLVRREVNQLLLVSCSLPMGDDWWSSLVVVAAAKPSVGTCGWAAGYRVIERQVTLLLCLIAQRVGAELLSCSASVLSADDLSTWHSGRFTSEQVAPLPTGKNCCVGCDSWSRWSLWSRKDLQFRE